MFCFHSRGGAARLVRLGCDGLARANVLGGSVLCQSVARSQETMFDEMYERVRTQRHSGCMYVLSADVHGQPRSAWGLGPRMFLRLTGQSSCIITKDVLS